MSGYISRMNLLDPAAISMFLHAQHNIRVPATPGDEE